LAPGAATPLPGMTPTDSTRRDTTRKSP
jgi:hypothetical protein